MEIIYLNVRKLTDLKSCILAVISRLDYKVVTITVLISGDMLNHIVSIALGSSLIYM